jgi:hypothetical protein
MSTSRECHSCVVHANHALQLDTGPATRVACATCITAVPMFSIAAILPGCMYAPVPSHTGEAAQVVHLQDGQLPDASCAALSKGRRQGPATAVQNMLT